MTSIRQEIEAILSDQRDAALLAGRNQANGRLKFNASVVIQIAVYLVTIMLGYAAVTSRLAVVETKQSDTERRLFSIENKIDVLLSRGDR